MENVNPDSGHSAFGSHEADAHDAREAASSSARRLRDEINRCLEEIRSVSDEQLPEVRQRLDALLADLGAVGHFEDVLHFVETAVSAQIG